MSGGAAQFTAAGALSQIFFGVLSTPRVESNALRRTSQRQTTRYQHAKCASLIGAMPSNVADQRQRVLFSPSIAACSCGDDCECCTRGSDAPLARRAPAFPSRDGPKKVGWLVYGMGGKRRVCCFADVDQLQAWLL